MYGIVYKITNKANGKVYIGQTTRNLLTRWSQHKSKKTPGCPLLKNAIGKYGESCFTIDIICRANSKEELDNRERLCIRLFKSISPFGYNLGLGGHTKSSHITTRQKMSMALKGKKRSPETIKLMSQVKLGKKLSKQTKQKMSMAKIGKARPEWVKKKISESTKGVKSHVYGKTGKNHPRSQAIVCLNDNLTYESMAAASRFYNVNPALITLQIQGKVETVRGLRFSKK